MKCSVGVLKEVRSQLQEEAKAAQARGEEVTSDGESFALAAKFHADLAGKVRDPDKVLELVQERALESSRPFHTRLRRELGEIITLTSDGKDKKYYVLASRMIVDADIPGGASVLLRVAPESNIGQVQSITFNLASDTAVQDIGKPEIVSEGITDILRKAVIHATNHALIQESEKQPVEHYGDKELKDTLDKMQDVDTVLGSRQKRSGESLKGYEKVPDYKHGDIDSMREIMGKLHVLGSSPVSESLIKYYNSLLDKMHPRFFNHVALYLKKNGIENVGEMNLTTGVMTIDIAKDTKGEISMSPVEIYIHEVLHSMVGWAMRQPKVNVGAYRIAIQNAMEVTGQHVTWEDFLEVPLEEASSREKDRARKMHDYVFTSKYNTEEFMSFVLSNPTLMRLTKDIKLKDKKVDKENMSVFEKVVEVFTSLINKVLGGFSLRDNDITVFEEINRIAFALAEVNNRNMHKLDTMNPVGKMMEVLEDSESYLSERIEKVKNVLKGDPKVKLPPDDANLFQRSKFVVAMLVKGMFDPHHRKYLGLVASAYGLRPEGSIREFFGSLTERSDAFRVVEKLNLLSTNVDSSRNSIINAGTHQLLKAFKVPPSEAEEEAMTSVLIDTNLSSLFYERAKSRKQADREIIALLTDNDVRYEREGRVKAKINKMLKDDPERAKWTIAQSVSLGYYMATGIGNLGTHTNAGNIAEGFGTNQRFKRSPELTALIGELATLNALNHTEKADRQIVATLLKTETKGVKAVTDMYETYKLESKELLFSDSSVHMMDGHSKELFDDTIDIEIAPEADRARLEADGFTMRYKLPVNSATKQGVPMAVYTTNSWGKNERLRGTVGLGRQHARGATLSSIKMMEDPAIGHALFQRDFGSAVNSSIAIHNSMREGTFDVTTVENGLVPVYNKAGQVVDFRYTMSKENKKKFLNQDLRISQVLPRSIASIEHQVRRDELNKAALLVIQEDMMNNWKEGEIGEDGTTEYALIGPNSADPEMQELFRMLPETYRNFIMSRTDKTMAVPRSLLRIYFGGQHMKTSELPGFKQLPGFIKSMVDVVEGIWMELIKISKGAILLKMPVILVLNMASNILYQVNNGRIDIVQLIRDYRESTKEVGDYIKNQRKATRLNREILSLRASAGRTKNKESLRKKISQKTAELKRLEMALLQNPAHELFEAGMYQSHVEDLAGSTLNDSNRLSRAVNDKLEKLPKPVRMAAELAYLTQNTSWYKMSQEVLQQSDMISRLVDNKSKVREAHRMMDGSKRLPKWWLEDKDKDYPERKVLTGEEKEQFLAKEQRIRMETLLDNYINYTLPNGNAEEYLNRLGIIMFTKYYKRVQKNIVNTASSNPIKTALLMSVILAGVDLDTVQDYAMIGRMFDRNGDFSLMNVIPVYSPMYHLTNVLTPAIVKDTHLGGII